MVLIFWAGRARVRRSREVTAVVKVMIAEWGAGESERLRGAVRGSCSPSGAAARSRGIHVTRHRVSELHRFLQRRENILEMLATS